MIGCPDCILAQSVRASVFDEHFWGILALVASPLLILGTIAALLYRLGLDSRVEYVEGTPP